jgi:hypothetical protein
MPLLLLSQKHCRGIDTVYSFIPGEGQDLGQGEEYFPENIFGFPSKIATYQVPEQSPEELLSLGFGGEIIVGFKDFVIEDQEGPDFIIFENAFQNPATKKLFVEPAKVSVSSDGVNFIEFQFDEETLIGCAGITPTIGDGDPCHPESIGGDAFDLADLSLEYVSHIKITDISMLVKSNTNHQYYDPIITGFDLDAVVGLHLRERSNSVEKSAQEKFKISNISHNIISIESNLSDVFVTLFNISGSAIVEKNIRNYAIIDCSDLSAGVYFLRILYGDEIKIQKILVY